MMLETMLLSHISFILGLAIDYISNQCLVLATALVASTRSFGRYLQNTRNMPKQVKISATEVAVNGNTNSQVSNARELTVLSARYSTKRMYVKVPLADGGSELKEENIRTINLRLSEDIILTSSGYRTNILNLDFTQFCNRLGSAADKDVRRKESALTGELSDDLSILEDIPIRISIFDDIDEGGNQIERYKIAF